jgi:hypothetical protein
MEKHRKILLELTWMKSRQRVVGDCAILVREILFEPETENYQISFTDLISGKTHHVEGVAHVHAHHQRAGLRCCAHPACVRHVLGATAHARARLQRGQRLAQARLCHNCAHCPEVGPDLAHGDRADPVVGFLEP